MRTVTSRLALLAVLLLSAPAAGRAEGGRAAESKGLLTPLGEYVLVGGGVSDFTKRTMKDGFDLGTTWDVRLGIGSRSYVGAEAAYVGSFRNASGSGLDLTTNGAEGVLRLQYPRVSGSWLVEPFAFGGIGWSRASLRDAPAGVKDSDDVGVVPFGAGVTVGYGRLLVDARFTYRTAFSEDLVAGPGGARASFEQWGAGASIGYEF